MFKDINLIAKNIDDLYPRYELWETQKFINTEDNPRQRDTVQRARNAHHLTSEVQRAHLLVNVAMTRDGQFYKLDEHTRGFIWSNENLAQISQCHLKYRCWFGMTPM